MKFYCYRHEDSLSTEDPPRSVPVSTWDQRMDYCLYLMSSYQLWSYDRNLKLQQERQCVSVFLQFCYSLPFAETFRCEMAKRRFVILSYFISRNYFWIKSGLFSCLRYSVVMLVPLVTSFSGFGCLTGCLFGLFAMCLVHTRAPTRTHARARAPSHTHTHTPVSYTHLTLPTSVAV